jgi:hypothetical protein
MFIREETTMRQKRKEANCRGILYFVFVALINVIYFVPVTFAEDVYKMKGRVVEYGGNIGIPEVTVDVRYSPDGRIQFSKKTDENGEYTFNIPVFQDHIWIAYTPENLNEYGTDGRENVANSADPKDLDTMGLVKKKQACGKSNIVVWGSVRFVLAGGGKKVAEVFPQLIFEKCAGSVESVRKDQKLVKELKRLEMLKENFR